MRLACLLWITIVRHAFADPVSPAGTATVSDAAVHDALWTMGPAITRDGSEIVVPVQAEDGARGSANLAIEIWTRGGKLSQRQVVWKLGEECPDAGCASEAEVKARLLPRERAAQQLLDDLRHRKGLYPMTKIEGSTTDPTHISAPGITVDLSATGTLTIQPQGRAALTRHSDAWLTKPSARQQARMNAELEKGNVPCFNAALLGAVWVDLPRRAAIVQIRYHGNDSCWEPDSERAVVAW